jgi:hypothetical protein
MTTLYALDPDPVAAVDLGFACRVKALEMIDLGLELFFGQVAFVEGLLKDLPLENQAVILYKVFV